ncbi:hypothetical protein DAPPUDRAFT_101679 [Daphnia pulex]|uniref:Apple domain-containing protein n=1 Tax=Daphnia pulex TaxID=6669 RepID=E9GE63_DAPPU|nr:hypothetical protein DAPPUDRAFT_101679 [Daphnia pulex]|eukprot:EFX82211.1 hypothetical protein DAPPUDRAFT_101679 [Daphnia pulex]
MSKVYWLFFLLVAGDVRAEVNPEELLEVKTTSDDLAKSEERCGIVNPSTTNRNIPSVTYSTNCDFCDHALYTVTCIPNAFACAALCAGDRLCSHFTYVGNLNRGTCRLKSAIGSGGSWASSVKAPSPYICGYIPSRALVDVFLNICVGTDITGVVRR